MKIEDSAKVPSGELSVRGTNDMSESQEWDVPIASPFEITPQEHFAHGEWPLRVPSYNAVNGYLVRRYDMNGSACTTQSTQTTKLNWWQIDSSWQICFWRAKGGVDH